ncbi:NAD(P)H-quinone oxidoreductase [Corynebacterium sp. 13CS0277]|uniref:NAD(P)H-quinone oxidoreductase n=1 Tax=Corynebacterium sp. 13CS0277 TaxID=2071994 RepID=UPI000D036FBD|nr:NAD(P)H-quinone oxidoreductase [Corynebacterium sp. 13CS0277]PRQ10432.1 NAD(P)H-quinone oxidoreductase [Corynebacterium sp. 13CS0277]
MKAITLSDPSDKTSLHLTEVPDPVPAAGEVVVRVQAAGVNRGDLLQAAGYYPPPPGASEIMGLECAGVIEDPNGHAEFSSGQPVACLLAGGGYAEKVAVPAGQVMPLPEGYSPEEAAAVVEVACTVYSNLVMLAGMHAGQTVLIHGGAGGIGTFAIQLAKHIGCHVIVTAGSPEKLEVCRRLGADELINYREDDFAELARGRADIILDIMGAKYLDRNITALAKDGHMVIIGMQGGTKAELNIGKLLAKRGTISATALRARDLDAKAKICRETVAAVWPLLSAGTITHQIHEVLPLAEAARAHQMLADGAVTGTLVLRVDTV